MMRLQSLLAASLALLLAGGTSSFVAAQNPPRAATPTYGQLVSAGYDLLREGKVKEAYLAAMMAAKADPTRFESFALAALIMHSRGADGDARDFVEKALGLAPADKKDKLRDLAKSINDSLAPNSVSGLTTAAAQVDPVEVALWNTIDKSRASDYDVYLKKYSNGIFADLARMRMAELGGKIGGTSGAAEPPAANESFLGKWKGTLVSSSKGNADVTAEILQAQEIRWINTPPSRESGDIVSGRVQSGSWSVLADQLTITIDYLHYKRSVGFRSCSFVGTIGQNQMRLTPVRDSACSSFTLSLTRK
jgi:hypothetical protein